MATEKDAANTAVKHEGDHDRVAMLSLKADGTPDQHNPEIIGNKEFATEATKRQFAEQAVSAADAQRREDSVAAETVKQDPTIEAAQKDDEKTVAAAEKAAEKVVESLHKG